MTRIKMKDTTSHAETGSLRAGEVYEVPADVADHLIDVGLAAKTTAQTTAERDADLANDGDTPSIEEQTAAAGTKPGDQSETVGRQPLNRPATESERRAATQQATGVREERRS